MRLKVWLKAGHTVQVIQRRAPEFTAATSIDLDLVVVPEEKAHDELVSGAPRPDVVTVPFWYLDELIAADVLRPLDGLNATDAGHSFPSAAHVALQRSGQGWAVPHTFTGGVLSYRTDLFEQAGLAPPATLADTIAAAEVLANDPAGGVHPVVARASTDFSSLETYSGWAWARGVRLLPDEGLPDAAVVEEGIADVVGVLRRTGPADLTSRDYAAVGQLVAEGRAAMLFDTSAWAFFFEEPSSSQVAGRMGYTTISGPAAPAQFLYAEGLGITAACAEPDAAAEFIRWRHSADVVRDEMESMGRIDLPRLDVWETEWFRDAVRRRGLGAYMDVVRTSWEQADPAHVPQRVDYVTQARRLMGAVAAVVDGRAPNLTAAMAALPEPGARGR